MLVEAAEQPAGQTVARLVVALHDSGPSLPALPAHLASDALIGQTQPELVPDAYAHLGPDCLGVGDETGLAGEQCRNRACVGWT
jgi:hypothetical protein